ncbi:MAG: hypothetical protein WCK09_20600 [Bacteroidota bacterium]
MAGLNGDFGISQIVSILTNVVNVGTGVYSQNNRSNGSGYYSQNIELTNGQPAIIDQANLKSNETKTVFSPTIVIISMVGVAALVIGLMVVVKKKK